MTYICIDLKSFYASVECVERGLDPLDTHLVVADESRTEKTICLAVTPSLKEYGISGRARLFEVIQKMKEVNNERLCLDLFHKFVDSSYSAKKLKDNYSVKADFIIAPPRMRLYMEVSSKIYGIYLKYIAPEDIHVYSVDEVFIDATNYLGMYKCDAHELACRMIRDVLHQTGITATAGIGTNMYLAKIAMDIVAKKIPPDKDGVRIAELNEMSYRRKLWSHTPMTDFWRFGNGITKRLEKLGIYNMGGLARMSETNEEILYKEFGINAELLIDHAWGYESCMISSVKSYRSENHSLSKGQVLPKPYQFLNARLIVKEMADQLSLELVRKKLVSDQIVLTVCYDHSYIPAEYEGELEVNHYGKITPKSVHGSSNIGFYTSSTKLFVQTASKLFNKLADRRLLVRRIYVVANHVVLESTVPDDTEIQYSLFDDVEKLEKKRADEKLKLSRERSIQDALVFIKEKYGNNAILKGMNYEEGGTAIERNGQVGGHRA